MKDLPNKAADRSPPGDLERLVNEREAAAFLGYTVRALQNWRVRGGGPLFVKVSERSVRYRRCDLITWIEAKLRASTSDPGRVSPPPHKSATPAAQAR